MLLNDEAAKEFGQAGQKSGSWSPAGAGGALYTASLVSCFARPVPPGGEVGIVQGHRLEVKA